MAAAFIKFVSVVLAAPQGFEPRYAAPEAAVLPLNEGATQSVSPLVTVPTNNSRVSPQTNQLVHHNGFRSFGQTPVAITGTAADSPFYPLSFAPLLQVSGAFFRPKYPLNRLINYVGSRPCKGARVNFSTGWNWLSISSGCLQPPRWSASGCTGSQIPSPRAVFSLLLSSRWLSSSSPLSRSQTISRLL